MDSGGLVPQGLSEAIRRRADPGALAKEVAYCVGFNDHLYFTQEFKRQLGVCPSKYQAGARLSFRETNPSNNQ